MWLRLWPLVSSRPVCREGRGISIRAIVSWNAEEVYGKGTFFFFPVDKDIFSSIFLEFSSHLRFDPFAATLLHSYQRHRRVTCLHRNNLNRGGESAAGAGGLREQVNWFSTHKTPHRYGSNVFILQMMDRRKRDYPQLQESCKHSGRFTL